MTEPRLEDEIDTTEVAKRKLRSALRQARSTAHLTQTSVARQLAWSTSKIVRIELGGVPVAPTDVQAMLRLYRVPDDEIDRLVELAKEIRRSKGSPELDEVMSAEYKGLVAHERVASVIFKYEPAVVPGLLQTQDYARELLRALGNSDTDAERLVEVRLRRQRLLDEPDRPELNIIIGEAALRRPAGSNEIMHEQVNHLLNIYEQYQDSGVNLWMLPFSAGPHRGMGNAFTIMEFTDEDLPDLLYLEGSERESLSNENEEDISKFKNVYLDLQRMAAQAGRFDELVNSIAVPLYAELVA